MKCWDHLSVSLPCLLALQTEQKTPPLPETPVLHPPLVEREGAQCVDLPLVTLDK